MKHFYLSLVALFALSAAVAAGENLLPGRWWGYGKQVPQIVRTANQGVLSFKNTAVQVNGFSSNVNLPPDKFKEVKIGCEVKATNVKGKNMDGNFCLYMDVKLADGKMSYGNKVNFPAGTYDWSKQSQVFKFAQPIKKINFYVLFRNVTGEAQARNIYLEAVK